LRRAHVRPHGVRYLTTFASVRRYRHSCFAFGGVMFALHRMSVFSGGVVVTHHACRNFPPRFFRHSAGASTASVYVVTIAPVGTLIESNETKLFGFCLLPGHSSLKDFSAEPPPNRTAPMLRACRRYADSLAQNAFSDYPRLSQHRPYPPDKCAYRRYNSLRHLLYPLF